MMKDKMENKNNFPGKPPSNKKIPESNHSPWIISIWFFLLWIFLSYLFSIFQDLKRIPLPYSTFRQQVQEGNVREVTITGPQIKGTFSKPYSLKTKDNEESHRFETFSTVKPDIDDPGLLELLSQKNVTVNAELEQGSWLFYALVNLLPWILIIGFFIYTSKKAGQQMQGLFGTGLSRARRFHKSKTNITFKDVAGMENAKNDLMEIIQYMKNPQKFNQLGASVPKGILLMGPPGCGKTLLAKATAGEAEIPFYSISGSEFIEMFVGVGASRVRDMFTNAKKEAPSIIFIDEIDAIGRTRGTGLGGGHDEREQTLNQILSEMDGFEPRLAVVVMAATNRPDVLDPALTRPGRFDRHITVELPQKQAREKILKIHTEHVPLSEDVHIENIASRTVGFSGADLKNLVNEAALLAGRKNKKTVDAQEFEEARDKILLGAEREEILTEEEKKLTAYHESGHALAAKLLRNADPPQKVTIIPRGMSLGSTEQIPEIDRHNYSKSYLLDLIAVRLGGRAAELVIFGEVSNGAASDLKQVTQIARKMVCQWGMSEKMGPVTFRLGEEHIFLGYELTEGKDFSENTAQIIDEEIRKIVSDTEKRILSLLQGNRQKLEALALALLKNETLGRSEIDKIIDSNNGRLTPSL